MRKEIGQFRYMRHSRLLRGVAGRSELRRIGRQLATAAALLLVGAVAGLAAAIATPTYVQIAGTQASIRLDVGSRYDELEFTGLLTGKRAAERDVLGEPIGVRVSLDLDTSTFVGLDGSFSPRVLPAYIQTYSNPHELARDAERAIVAHLLRWVLAGVLLAVAALAAGRGYLAWRHRQDARLNGAAEMRAVALAYHAAERRLLRRAVLVLALIAAVAAVPSSSHVTTREPPIVPTPLLDGTPLAGAEVGGPLLPAFDAAESYIRRYFADTDTYYEQVRRQLVARLDAGEVSLPSAPGVTQVGFVTDRHCNTGMDRVIVALLQRLGVRTLVSAGDDAFSGTFGFESACTAGLASATRRAHITDVFVGGNHDSPLTLTDEARQGIKVLDGKPVTANGLTFVGLPDPRTSRYGEGLRPAGAAVQSQLVAGQGASAGSAACTNDGPAIVVLHDPRAGEKALQSGCSNAVLALDGHTHRQSGPTPLTLADGSTGYLLTGASAGGAPPDRTIEHGFASKLTVGPLNHDATINIVSVDTATGRLVGLTRCVIRPDQDIEFSQQFVSG
jgi:hypothetical protein